MLPIAANLTFKLSDGREIGPHQFEQFKDRFQFIEWNVIAELALFLKMISKTGMPGYIEISENRWMVMKASDNNADILSHKTQC